MSFIKKLALLCFSIFLFGAALPSMAQTVEDSDPLVVDLASDHIDVTVGFMGSTIEVYGDRRDTDTQVAVVVEGPVEPVAIWKKEKIAGAWINRHYAKFNSMPLYYNYAVSPSDFIEKNEFLSKENVIGLDAVFKSSIVKRSDASDRLRKFKEFLIKTRQKKGVFPENPAPIKFLNGHFFHITFKIPPSVPTGEYKVHSYLVKGGRVVKSDISTLKVEQVGLNAFLLHAAQKHAFLYALFCVLFAGLSGWFASILRVRP